MWGCLRGDDGAGTAGVAMVAVMVMVVMVVVVPDICLRSATGGSPATGART